MDFWAHKISDETVDNNGIRHLYRGDTKKIVFFDIRESDFYRAGSDSYKGNYEGYTYKGFKRVKGKANRGDIATWAQVASESPFSYEFKELVLNTDKFSGVLYGGGSTVTMTATGVELFANSGAVNGAMVRSYRATDGMGQIFGDIEIEAGFTEKVDGGNPRPYEDERFSLGHYFGAKDILADNGYFVECGVINKSADGKQYFYIRVGHGNLQTPSSVINGVTVEKQTILPIALLPATPLMGKFILKRIGNNWTGTLIVYNSSLVELYRITDMIEINTWQWPAPLLYQPYMGYYVLRNAKEGATINGYTVLMYDFVETPHWRNSVAEFPEYGTFIADGRDFVILDENDNVWFRFIGGNGLPISIPGYKPGNGYYRDTPNQIIGLHLTASGFLIQEGVLYVGMYETGSGNSVLFEFDFINDVIKYYGAKESTPTTLREAQYKKGIGYANHTEGWFEISPVNWNNSTPYVVGDYVKPPTGDWKFYYKCIQSGTSSATEPIWSSLTNPNEAPWTDGTVKWQTIVVPFTFLNALDGYDGFKYRIIDILDVNKKGSKLWGSSKIFVTKTVRVWTPLNHDACGVILNPVDKGTAYILAALPMIIDVCVVDDTVYILGIEKNPYYPDLSPEYLPIIYVIYNIDGINDNNKLIQVSQDRGRDTVVVPGTYQVQYESILSKSKFPIKSDYTLWNSIAGASDDLGNHILLVGTSDCLVKITLPNKLDDALNLGHPVEKPFSKKLLFMEPLRVETYGLPNSETDYPILSGANKKVIDAKFYGGDAVANLIWVANSQ